MFQEPQLIFNMVITTAAVNIVILLFFLEKIRLDISYESSIEQMIHTKCQVLFLTSPFYCQ